MDDRITFECRRCGKCCQGDAWLRNLLKPSDVQRWRALGREDILKYVCACCCRLVDPEKENAPWTRKDCPFLLREEGGLTRCGIHDVRPQVCRDFPVRKCTNPECPQEFHFHDWLWQGKCEAALDFRRKIVRAVQPKIAVDDLLKRPILDDR